MASSRLIVAGETYTADDVNNLRADVLDNAAGHDHDGTDGKKVLFKDLDVTTGTAGSAAPSGGTHGYDDLDDHLDASAGVHGLNASVNVVGSNAAAMLVQGGSSTLTGVTKVVSFPVTYSAAPSVVAIMTQESTGVEARSPWISGVSTTQFTMNAHATHTGHTFNWIAMGLKSA